MSESCPAPVSTAPEFAGILRKRLENVPLKVVASDLGYDESHVGKFLRGAAALTLAHVEKLLLLADLKAVDRRRVCIDPGLLAYYKRLHARVEAQSPWLAHDDEV